MATNDSAPLSQPRRKRFDLLTILTIPSTLILLFVGIMWIRSYYAGDRWARVRDTDHTSFITGYGGIEYAKVHWAKSDRELTNGFEYEAQEPMPTWRASPFGGGPWKHNFLGLQYVEQKPPARSRGTDGGVGAFGGAGGMAPQEVTAVQERLRIPYWMVLAPFAILPLIWLVRWQVRRARTVTSGNEPEPARLSRA